MTFGTRPYTQRRRAMNGDDDMFTTARQWDDYSSQSAWDNLIKRAENAEAELTAARTAAGIDAGEPLDEWIKAQREDHAEMTRRRDEARRENALHITRINGIMRWINDGNDVWRHTMNDEGDCSYCMDEWPCNSELIRRILLGESDAEMIAADVPSDKIEIEYKP